MTTLDVALRLRLINQLTDGAKAAARDLAGIKTAARGLDGRGPDRLKRDILDVASASRQAGRGMAEMRREATGLGTARGPDRLKRDLLEVSSAARTAERSLAGAKKAAQQVRDERGRFSTAPGGKAPAGGGHTMVGGTPRMMGALGGGYLGYRTVSAGVRSVVDQDKAWAEVLKKVNGTPEQLAALQAELRGMSNKFGMQVPEAFQQAAAAGAAGIDIKELPQAVRIGLMASKAWDTNARETMQHMAEMKSALGWNLDTLKDWADKVNALADASAASERALVEAAKRSNAAGAAVGLDSDTVLGITAAQISGGMPEEVASRWLNTFSSRLAGAHAGTKKQKEALKEYLGLDPEAVGTGMEKDARGTIMDVLRRFQGLEQKKRVAFGIQFFGQEWWDETARAAKVIPEITRMFDILGDKSKWSGSMQQNLAIELNTIASHWDRISAATSNAAEALDRMSGLSKGFKDVSEGLKAGVEAATEVMISAAKRNEEIERNKRRQETAQRERGLTNDLAAKDSAVAIAERDLAAAEATAKLRPGLGRDPGDARRRLERLRLERAELGLRIEALKERPPIDLTPSPEAPSGSGLPHKPLRRPVGLPPVQILEDAVPHTAEAKVQAAMDGISKAIATGGEKAVAESKSLVERIKALFNSLNFTVTPTISPRFGGSNGGPAQPQSGAGGAPTAPPQRQARAGVVITGPVNFHGIRDIAAAHRELAALQDRDVTEARESALHDTWSYA